MSHAQERTATRSRYGVRLALFVVCAIAVLIGLNVGSQALYTLRQLDAIEADRDQWQRPSEVLAALNVKPGDSVVDLGFGSGYFSLKLSAPAGPKGRVIAEDIRRLSLAFLWMRTVRKGKHNIKIVLGDVDDPHLHPNSVNAVLISNTYHEFTAPGSIMEHVRQAMVPGGRLVIIDRTPQDSRADSGTLHEHEIASDRVEADLRQANFAVDSRQDHFIRSDPQHESWWMIVAHRP